MHIIQYIKVVSGRKFLLATLVVLLLVGAGMFVNLLKTKKDKYLIGVILSNEELKPGELEVYKLLIARKTRQINRSGGINGHKIKTILIDDDMNDDKLYNLVLQTSKNENLIAYIGCRGVSRARKIAPILYKKNIPFIGQYAYTDILRQYTNMYTASVGTSEAKLVLLELLKARASRVGFIGEKNKPTSERIQKILQQIVPVTPGLQLTMQRFLPGSFQLGMKNKQELADSIKSKTDFLIVNATSTICDSIINLLKEENINIPVFVSSSLTDVLNLDRSNPGYLSTELFSINTFGISGTQNTRLLEEFSQIPNRPKTSPPEYVLSNAGRIADELGLLQEAANGSTLHPKTPIRQKINAGLKMYINGRKIYHGWLTDWTFTPEHAYSGESLLAWKPQNNTNPMLAATQFIRSGNNLIAAPVYFTNLNMIEISQVNEDEETFYASFYLELQTKNDFDLDQIDFSNAVKNDLDHTPILNARLIRSAKGPLQQQFYQRIYKISGLFHFEPDLKKYPLDEQKFFIVIQAANAWKPVFLQPSATEDRDSVFESEGWNYKGQYIGFNQDIIVTPQAFGYSSKNIQNHKFTYTYILQRSQIDFFLKTLVPLLAIITVAYFSVYIPMREFEALAGIQVTSLLSSIALYFATYKPQTPYATTSDKIFIFTYIMVTSLIGCSILIYVMYRKRFWLIPIVIAYQRYIFPFIIIAFLFFIRQY